jgi:hypothetical protein
MVPIRVASDLWNTSIFPNGNLQRWLQPDGAFVEAGDAASCVQIENRLYDVLSPAAGWLTVDSRLNSVVEPGTMIGHLGVP